MYSKMHPRPPLLLSLFWDLVLGASFCTGVSNLLLAHPTCHNVLLTYPVCHNVFLCFTGTLYMSQCVTDPPYMSQCVTDPPYMSQCFTDTPYICHRLIRDTHLCGIKVWTYETTLAQRRIRSLTVSGRTLFNLVTTTSSSKVIIDSLTAWFIDHHNMVTWSIGLHNSLLVHS